MKAWASRWGMVSWVAWLNVAGGSAKLNDCAGKEVADRCTVSEAPPENGFAVGAARVVGRVDAVRCGSFRPGGQGYVAEITVDKIIRGTCEKKLTATFVRGQAPRAAAALSGVRLLTGERAEIILTRDPSGWTIAAPQDVKVLSPGKGTLPRCP